MELLSSVSISHPFSPPSHMCYGDCGFIVLLSSASLSHSSSPPTLTLRTWDVFSGRGSVETLSHNHDVLAVAFAPNGKQLAAATLNGDITLWNPHEAELVVSVRVVCGVGLARTVDIHRIYTVYIHMYIHIYIYGYGQPYTCVYSMPAFVLHCYAER